MFNLFPVYSTPFWISRVDFFRVLTLTTSAEFSQVSYFSPKNEFNELRFPVKEFEDTVLYEGLEQTFPNSQVNVQLFDKDCFPNPFERVI